MCHWPRRVRLACLDALSRTPDRERCGPASSAAPASALLFGGSAAVLPLPQSRPAEPPRPWRGKEVCVGSRALAACVPGLCFVYTGCTVYSCGEDEYYARELLLARMAACHSRHDGFTRDRPGPASG